MKKIFWLFFLIFITLNPKITSASNSRLDFLQKYAKPSKNYSINHSYFNPLSQDGIIILEDAHCNELIQRRIIKLITTINADLINSGINLNPIVMQEGGQWGKIDTSLIKKFHPSSNLENFLNTKLTAGEIGAAEYLHVKEANFTLFGIENIELYEKNYHLFIDLAHNKIAIDQLLSDIKKKLNRLIHMVFSEELKDFYFTIQDSKNTDIKKHLEKLHLLSLQYKINLQKHKTIAQYFESIEALEKIDYKAVENDLNKYITATNQKIKIEDAGLLLKKNKISIKNYPELFKYAKLKNHVLSMQMLDFVKEKKALEKQLLINMTHTDEEKELVKALNDFFITEKIMSLTLTRDEYEYYKNINTENYNPLLETMIYIKSYFYSYTTAINTNDLIKKAEAFYTVVRQRDVALTNNIEKALKKYQPKIATLVIGGFHTEGITQLLQDKKISYIVITPNTEGINLDGMNTYYEVMKKFWLNDKTK